MNKTDFRKSGLVSAMLVALAFAVFVPAVIADSDASVSGSYFGEGVGAGVQATPSGGYYYGCYWHVGRWLGACHGYYTDLYFTLYADGDAMSSSTGSNTYDSYYAGPLESLGASGASGFYNIYYGAFYWSSGLAWLP